MDNGLVLNDFAYIPPEILAQILRFVHPSSLIHSCRLVCRSWNEIILDDVWKSIVLRSSNLNSIEKRQVKYPYPFGRNLLRNNSAQGLYFHWKNFFLIRFLLFLQSYLYYRWIRTLVRKEAFRILEGWKNSYWCWSFAKRMRRFWWTFFLFYYLLLREWKRTRDRPIPKRYFWIFNGCMAANNHR